MAKELIGFAAYTGTSICSPCFVGSCSFLVISSSLMLARCLLCGCFIICLDFSGSAVRPTPERYIVPIAFVDTAKLGSLGAGVAARIMRAVEG